MTLPLKWAKMIETEFVPHEYHDQHKNRTKKLNTLVGCLRRYIDKCISNKRNPLFRKNFNLDITKVLEKI